MESQSILLVLSVMVALAWAYPTTVPATPEVCSKMTPGHGPVPQSSKSPYTVDVSTNSVKGGNNVEVTLDGNEETFKGFYVQARDSTGARVGTFFPDNGIVKTHGCDGLKNNAAHHSGNNDKESVTVHWKAPAQYTGTVTFVATFVEDFENFWTNVKSAPVTVSPQLAPFMIFLNSDKSSKFASTDSREKRATTKSTQESRILNYNPYSPFLPFKNGRDFTSNEFLPSVLNHPQDNYTSINESSSKDTEITSNSRIRKNYYISPILQSDVIINDDFEHCKHNHKISVATSGGGAGWPSPTPPPSIVPIPVSNYNYATRYTYTRGQPPIAVSPNPTPGPVGGGFQILDGALAVQSPGRNYKNGPSKTVKFYDDDLHQAPHFRPSYYPSDLHSFGLKHQGHHQSPSKGGNAWTSTAHLDPNRHGIIGNDYGAIDTAIVLPKGMQSFNIPRYGYLVFNPKRGPPFYLIPAENEAFENSHFRLARSSSKKEA